MTFRQDDLIEPYWNVKVTAVVAILNRCDRDLIEPYWNVKEEALEAAKLVNGEI